MRVARALGVFVAHPAFLYAFSFGVVGLTFKQAGREGEAAPAELALAVMSACTIALLLASRITGEIRDSREKPRSHCERARPFAASEAISRRSLRRPRSLELLAMTKTRWNEAFLHGFLSSSPHREMLRRIGAAVCVFLSLSIGTVWALIVEPSRVSLHDVLAFSFTFTIMCAFLVLANEREAFAFRALAGVIGSTLAAFVIAGLTPSSIQRLMWYFDNDDHLRLQGLSDNPNQVAFLALVGLGLAFLPVWEGRAQRFAQFGIGLGSATAGVWTRSLAFKAAMIFLLCLAIALVATARVGATRPSPVRRIPWPMIAVLAGILAVPDSALRSLHSVPAPERLWLKSPFAEVFAELVDREGGPKVLRMPSRVEFRAGVWRSAVEAIGRSPVVGLGMGAHLPFPEGFVRADQQPFVPLQEAHNTVLDVLVIAGVVGLAPLLFVVARILMDATRTGSLGVVGLVGGPAAIFAMAHFVARQPLFWIVLVACAWVSGSREAAQAAKE